MNGPLYGQVVAGPPGSGKTTYCTGMQEYLRLLGRDAWVINLDPANEVPSSSSSKPNTNNNEDNNNDTQQHNELPYETLLDVCDDVVNLSSVMKQLQLGPNGGLMYCMEYLEAHIDDVVEMIQSKILASLQQSKSTTTTKSNSRLPYLIFDLPGQVELYTHGTAVPSLLNKLVKILDLRLVAIQLIDSHYCTQPSNFVSAALLGITTMLRLELPTVNILSKIDLLVKYGQLPFDLNYFTDCQDLDRLIPFLQEGGTSNTVEDNNNDIDDDEYEDYGDDIDYQKARTQTRSSPFFRKHEKLHRVLGEVVDEFGLLSFLPLDVSDAESMGRVLSKIDKCNGYIFVDNSNNGSNKQQDLFQCAIQSANDSSSNYETIADIQERLYDMKVQKQKQQQQQQT